MDLNNKKRLFEYTVVRYIQDIVRDEPKNIGLVIHDVEEFKTYCYFPEDIIFHKVSFKSHMGITTYIKYLEEHVKFYNIFETINTVSCIQFTEKRGAVDNNYDSVLEYLSKTFIL